MCCCGKPTVNGQPGYKWQPNDAPSTRPAPAPEIGEGDELLYDEPGRCGRGSDSHCHHFRIVKHTGALYILVRHGGGQERHQFGWSKTLCPTLAAMDSDGRFWMCQAAHHAMRRAEDTARTKEAAEWREAAAEKRIKTRRQRKPNENLIKVWIEPRKITAQ